MPRIQFIISHSSFARKENYFLIPLRKTGITRYGRECSSRSLNHSQRPPDLEMLKNGTSDRCCVEISKEYISLCRTAGIARGKPIHGPLLYEALGGHKTTLPIRLSFFLYMGIEKCWRSSLWWNNMPYKIDHLSNPCLFLSYILYDSYTIHPLQANSQFVNNCHISSKHLLLLF